MGRRDVQLWGLDTKLLGWRWGSPSKGPDSKLIGDVILEASGYLSGINDYPDFTGEEMEVREVQALVSGHIGIGRGGIQTLCPDQG